MRALAETCTLAAMKVFISSLISGFQPFRSPTKAAIQTLRHQPLMAEDIGARPDSPQIACLQSARESDLVVLILGERYGVVQARPAFRQLTRSSARRAIASRYLCSCKRALSARRTRTRLLPRCRLGKVAISAVASKPRRSYAML